MPEWSIYVRDSAYERVAEVDDFQRLDLVPRFNGTGRWEMEINWDAPAADEFRFRRGIIAVRDGVTEFSGRVGRLVRTWDAERDALVVGGPSDDVWLQWRLAYPEAPALTTATSAYDVRTGLASTVMYAYVENNVGPSANSTRRVSGLTLAVDPRIGSTVTGRGRFHTLGEILRELALSGGDLGFRILQSGAGIMFSVYQPVDRTGSVIFGEEFGNLESFEYSREDPASNFVVVAGGGEGTARTFVTGGDSASITTYDMIEAFQDRRDTTDATELTQARDETLTEGAARTGLRLVPVDTTGIAYRTNYALGDDVSAIVDGVLVQERIREVAIRLDADGERIYPVIGSPGEELRWPLPLFDRLRRVETRIGNMEKRR